jgi:hypothetical protein
VFGDASVASSKGGLKTGGGTSAVFVEEDVATTGISSTMFGEDGVGVFGDASTVSSEGEVESDGCASAIFVEDDVGTTGISSTIFGGGGIGVSGDASTISEGYGGGTVGGVSSQIVAGDCPERISFACGFFFDLLSLGESSS